LRSAGKRVIAASATVVAGAAVNIATGMLTQHWAAAWWAAVAVTVAVGALAQVYLTVADSPAAVVPSGSIVIGGDVTGVVNTGDGAIIGQHR
jgi:hypothetical protein